MSHWIKTWTQSPVCQCILPFCHTKRHRSALSTQWQLTMCDQLQALLGTTSCHAAWPNKVCTRHVLETHRKVCLAALIMASKSIQLVSPLASGRHSFAGCNCLCAHAGAFRYTRAWAACSSSEHTCWKIGDSSSRLTWLRPSTLQRHTKASLHRSASLACISFTTFSVVVRNIVAFGSEADMCYVSST